MLILPKVSDITLFADNIRGSGHCHESSRFPKDAKLTVQMVYAWMFMMNWDGFGPAAIAQVWVRQDDEGHLDLLRNDRELCNIPTIGISCSDAGNEFFDDNPKAKSVRGD